MALVPGPPPSFQSQFSNVGESLVTFFKWVTSWEKRLKKFNCFWVQQNGKEEQSYLHSFSCWVFRYAHTQTRPLYLPPLYPWRCSRGYITFFSWSVRPSIGASQKFYINRCLPSWTSSLRTSWSLAYKQTSEPNACGFQLWHHNHEYWYIRPWISVCEPVNIGI